MKKFLNLKSKLGFTLLESIVAIAVGMIGMVAIGELIRMNSKGQKSIESRSDFFIDANELFLQLSKSATCTASFSDLNPPQVAGKPNFCSWGDLNDVPPPSGEMFFKRVALDSTGAVQDFGDFIKKGIRKNGVTYEAPRFEQCTDKSAILVLTARRDQGIAFGGETLTKRYRIEAIFNAGGTMTSCNASAYEGALSDFCTHFPCMRLDTRAGSSTLGICVPCQTSCEQNDIDGDGKVTNTDVQLVINGALGINVTPKMDVNMDNRVDASDVQLVINALLMGDCPRPPSLCSDAGTCKRADVNQDGKIDQADVDEAINCSLGLSQNPLCDFNCSGGPVNATDIQEIINCSLTYSPPPCTDPEVQRKRADFNGDGHISASEYQELLDAITANNKSRKYDLNCDGRVDGADAAISLGFKRDFHSADLNYDHVISCEELTEVKYLRDNPYGIGGEIECKSDTATGYKRFRGGAKNTSCPKHDTDYNGGGNWAIGPVEFSKLVDIFNAGGYHKDPTGPDGMFSPTNHPVAEPYVPEPCAAAGTLPWPAGSYCVMMAGGSCPSGFNEQHIYLKARAAPLSPLTDYTADSGLYCAIFAPFGQSGGDSVCTDTTSLLTAHITDLVFKFCCK